MLIEQKQIIVYPVCHLKVRSATFFTADAVCCHVDYKSLAELLLNWVEETTLGFWGGIPSWGGILFGFYWLEVRELGVSIGYQ